MKSENTVDIVIFTVRNSELEILLIKRNAQPYLGEWALPGGFFSKNDSLEEAAKKKLYDEAGVKDVYLEQLYTFGDPKRDPRGRIITISYFALINSENIKLDVHVPDVKEAEWVSVKNLPKLAFDHEKIVSYALQRLKWKLEYTNVVYSLLPEKFTLTEMQKVYETILSERVDKRNFRKKILSLKLLKDTKKIKKDVSHRPAKLYSFRKKEPEIIDIL